MKRSYRVSSIVLILMLFLTVFAFGDGIDKNVTIHYSIFKVQVDGKALNAKGTPFVMDGQTYIPASMVNAMFGSSMTYDPKAGLLSVKTSKTAVKPPVLRQVTLHLFKYGYDPMVVTVNKGDRVRLTLISDDDDHGFYLKEFNVNHAVMQGESVTVEFTADKIGTFIYYCNMFCGKKHSDVKGMFRVME